MCDCIKEIEKKVHEKFPVYNRKKVLNVSAHVVFKFPDMKSVTTTDFNLELENQKKEVPVAVNHTFCPFCGERNEPIKIEKEDLITEIGQKLFDFLESYFSNDAVFGTLTSEISVYGLLNVDRNDISILSLRKALKLYMHYRKFEFNFTTMRIPKTSSDNGFSVVTGFIANIKKTD